MTTPSSDPSAGPPEGQPQYGQPQYGQPQYGQPAYGQPAYGQPQYGQPQYGQPAYGAPPSPFGQPGGPQLAGWGARVGAALLDGLLTLVPIIVGAVLGAIIGADRLFLGLGYLAGFGVLFWNHARQGTTGQTVGKSVVGLRLLREADGQVVGAGLSIGRYFVHILDSLPCYLGYLWPLWDDKKQTFADKILNTVVVKA